MFTYAKPITLKLTEEKHKLSAFYAANFDCNGEDAILYITCSKSAKITVNGDFAGYIEPLIDGYKITGYEIDISSFVSWGLNQIVVEVFSNTPNSFLLAELYADGKIKCATGENFIGFIDTERVFDETVLTNAFIYEHYIKGGLCMLKGNVKKLTPEYLVMTEKYKLKQKTEVLLQNKTIKSGEEIVLTLDKPTFAHLNLSVFTKGKAALLVETSTNKTFKTKSVLNVNFEAGEYNFENHTAHKFKYIRLCVNSGEIELDLLKINALNS